PISHSFGAGEQFDRQQIFCKVDNRAEFQGAVIPIAKGSFFPPDVGTLSMLDGWARTLASLSRVAAATCAIMKPDSMPGRRARNAGKPSFMSGLIRRSIRRSLMLIKSVSAMAA